MQEVCGRIESDSDSSLPFPKAAAIPAGEGWRISIRVQDKGSWLNLAADRRPGGGLKVIIDSDAERFAAEVATDEEAEHGFKRPSRANG